MGWLLSENKPVFFVVPLLCFEQHKYGMNYNIDLKKKEHKFACSLQNHPTSKQKNKNECNRECNWNRLAWDQVPVSSSVQVTSSERVQGSVPDNSCNKYNCVSRVLIYNRQVWGKGKTIWWEMEVGIFYSTVFIGESGRAPEQNDILTVSTRKV